ncbi:30S ribosomal protein S11 [Candidatus Saccharibacteria bacterium]|nr:30S ribosomal protein S11 [Candidatus Saccharibacteria bacterium]
MADKIATVDEVKEVVGKSNQPEETSIDTRPKTVKKKKHRRTVTQGQVHVLATFNNTIITVTDIQGNTLAAASAGSCGFRGSKKGTAYAAQIAAEKAVETAKTYGVSKVDVFVNGIGMGREAAIRTLVARQISVDNIRDVTGTPHGGVRPRKAKRN